jgi:hypothetical protein
MQQKKSSNSFDLSERPAGYVRYRLGRLIKVVHPTPIYQRPDLRAPIYWRVPARYYLMMQRQRGSWCGVLMQNGSLGWLPRRAVQITPYEVVYTLPRGVDPHYVTRLAMQYLGVRYRWGGNNPRTGIDCSGFVKLVYEQLGVRLPRRAREQALKGIPITQIEQLQPGDLLFFAVKRHHIDHTGIYIGEGYFIHSARSRGGVAIDHLSHPLYRRSLVAARRL